MRQGLDDPMIAEHPRRVLFLCTGNYYRSRFAEFYFRHLAVHRSLAWEADSRGLELHATNLGPISRHTVRACEARGIEIGPLRFPLPVERSDLEAATITVALKEAEHRWRMRAQFPDWEDRIEYWQVHDLDVAEPHDTLQQIEREVSSLLERIQRVHRGLA